MTLFRKVMGWESHEARVRRARDPETSPENLEALVTDKSWAVCASIARNPNVSRPVLDLLGEWWSSGCAMVLVAVVRNRKTPRSTLSRIRERLLHVLEMLEQNQNMRDDADSGPDDSGGSVRPADDGSAGAVAALGGAAAAVPPAV